jgi:hypothetical protein
VIYGQQEASKVRSVARFNRSDVKESDAGRCRRERLETGRQARGERSKGHVCHKGSKLIVLGPDRAVVCLHPLGSFLAPSECYILVNESGERGVLSSHVWGI